MNNNTASQVSTPSYSKAYKRYLIILLMMLLFITQAATDIFVPGLPVMAREFGVSPAKMNMTISYYVCAQAILFLIMGIISDVAGRRNTILISLIISIIATFAISESHNVNLIIFYRVLQALGSGAVYIVSRLIIKEVYDSKEQLEITGIFMLGLVISPAIAPVIGAFIINHLDWRATFIFIGSSLSILTFLSFFVIKESNLQIDKHRSEFKLNKMLLNYYTVIINGLFIRYLFIVGGTFASFYAFIAMSSYMYIDEYHISNMYYSSLFMIIAMGYLIGNNIMIYKSRHGSSFYDLIKIGINISFAAIALTLLSLLLRDKVIIFIGLITIGGILIRLATAFINPPIQVGVIHAFPNNSSSAVGLISSIQYVFAAFGAWFVGIMPYQPSTNIIISTIGFTILTILAFYTLRPGHEMAASKD